jgi:GNAT superfamily N-acetyltransferase
MILIFADGSCRGRGLGAILLARCERLLLDRGHDRYVIKTDDDPANRALSFYERHGFVLRRRFSKLGTPYQLFEKYLNHGAADC